MPGHSANLRAMGIMDRLAGTPRDRFARQVLATARSAGIAQAWYDREQFAVGYRRVAGTGDPDGWIYLGNVFHECQGAGRAERARRIAQLVENVVHHQAMPDTWAAARADLRPVLRAGTFARSGPAGGPLRRPALPYLDELVVIDRPTTMGYVSRETAASWGVPDSEIYATARANLGALATLPDPPADGAAGGAGAVLRFVDSGDGYFVSRLLLDGWLGGLTAHVGGRPVAFVPDHNTLIVTRDDPDLLGKLYELAGNEYEQAARQLSPVGYALDPYGRLAPYQAPDGHPLAAVVGRAQALLSTSEYAAQAQALRAEYEADGRDVFVATLSRAKRPDGTAFTFATWAEGVDTLLPRADHVGIAADDHPPFFVAWDTLAREVDLEPVDGVRPERYRLTTWPPAGVVQRLRDRSAMP
jgi:hypothetical protein